MNGGYRARTTGRGRSLWLMTVMNWVAVAGIAAGGDVTAFIPCRFSLRWMSPSSAVRRVAPFRRCSSAAAVRNLGIMAHIDAGKTTTTERMLFQSGYMSRLGEVHTGDTVMDYMSQVTPRNLDIITRPGTMSQFFKLFRKTRVVSPPCRCASLRRFFALASFLTPQFQNSGGKL